MSRLDDELRMAFRREQPPPDFVDRVMRQVAAAPAPKASWRRSILALFEPPRIRWVAAAVAASLLVAVGVLQYSKSQRVEVEQANKGVAAFLQPEKSSPERDGKAPVTTGNNSENASAPISKKNNTRRPRKTAPVKTGGEIASGSAEQAAKEKLILALQIASESLGETQRLVKGED